MGAKHTHFYGRKQIYSGKVTVWACHLPDCNHYQPVGTQIDMLIGKNSICWSCAKEFRLTRERLQYDNPCCSDKCQQEYSLQQELIEAAAPPPIKETNEMCEKCGIRLKHGSLNWCWDCAMG